MEKVRRGRIKQVNRRNCPPTRRVQSQPDKCHRKWASAPPQAQRFACTRRHAAFGTPAESNRSKSRDHRRASQRRFLTSSPPPSGRGLSLSAPPLGSPRRCPICSRGNLLLLLFLFLLPSLDGRRTERRGLWCSAPHQIGAASVVWVRNREGKLRLKVPG